MKYRFGVLFLFLIETVHADTSRNHNILNKNPYQILGLSSNATQEEIKKAYRTQCLKYHPDKHVNKSIIEQHISEQKFKEIQEAYSRIGTKEARHVYHTNFSNSSTTSATSTTRSASHPYYPYGNGDEYGYRYTRPKMAFYVNGVDVSHFFHSPSSSSFFSSSPLQATLDEFFRHSNISRATRTNNDTTRQSNHYTNNDSTTAQESTSKSIYIQKVRIPLQELYSGVSHKPFVLKDNVWKRYQAAYRGGILTQDLLTSLWTTLPFFIRSILLSPQQRRKRQSFFLSLGSSLLPFLATFLFFLDYQIPRLHRTTFHAPIQKGWKGGTKLKFHVQSDMDVIFILEEEDETFERVGDDLMTCLKLKEEDVWKSVLGMLGEEEKDVKDTHGGGPTIPKKLYTIWIDSLEMKQKHGGIGDNESDNNDNDHRIRIPIEIPLDHDSIQDILKDKKPLPCSFDVTVKGKGWPKPKERGGGYGDLIVKIQIVPDGKSRNKMRRKKNMTDSGMNSTGDTKSSSISSSR